MNLPIQGGRVNPTNKESTKICFFLELDPKSCGLSIALGVGGQRNRRTLMEGFIPQLIPLLLQGTWGRMREFTLRTKHLLYLCWNFGGTFG